MNKNRDILGCKIDENCQEKEAGDLPVVIAHRGAMAKYAENTIQAFDASLIDGLHGIELDIQLTSDGVPVIFHDRTLKKLGHSLKRMAGISLVELKKLKYISSGQPVPTFKEVLERYGGKIFLFIEIKARGGVKKSWSRHVRTVETIIEMLSEDLKGKVAIQCFFPELIKLVKKKTPDLICILNVNEKYSLKEDKSILHLVDGVCFCINYINSSMVEVVHGMGKTVFTYRCNSESDFKKAGMCRVDGLLTDDPAWLISFLNL